MSRERETADVVEAAIRMVHAVGKRVGDEQPESLHYLKLIEHACENERREAIDRLRELGFTDVQIGDALGMTRQAVQQRWPRAGGPVGAGARWVRR